VGRLEVGAVILIGAGAGYAEESLTQSPNPPGGSAGLALQDVLGKPIFHRSAEMLRRQSVNRIAVVSEFPLPPLSSCARDLQSSLQWQEVPSTNFWRAAENAFNDVIQNGADEVIVLRLGAYTELDVQDLLVHHFEKRCRVTSALAPDGSPLDVFAISGNRRNDAAFLFRHELQQTRTPCESFVFRGYINPLQEARDLRRLAVHALLQRVNIQPDGQEVRPGIWAAKGAYVHPEARVVAPAFIGERARVLSRAVVTRCGVIEHHAIIARESVVEDATVLPFTRVGTGLDISHAIASGERLLNLRRNVEVNFADSRFLSSIPQRAPLRAVESAAALTAFLPAQLVRGIAATFRPGRQKAPLPGVPARVRTEVDDRHSPERVSNFAANVVVARRYGNE